MANNETVISWLEGLAEDDWRECYSDSEVQETARQALDLIDELLKEPEAVEPKITTFPKKDHDDSHIYRCGNCDMIIFKSHKYCPFCGKAVKWNE